MRFRPDLWAELKHEGLLPGECAYAVIAGQDDAREGSMKSYAMALDLRDDAEVIEQYKGVSPGGMG